MASAAALVLAALVTAVGPVSAQEAVSFSAADGEPVYASWYRTSGDRSAVVVAFHQGGASGEAEYGPIVPRLNAAGYDVLAVDQRAGGELFDGRNRTVEARGDEADYCDAVSDVAGALQFARDDAAGLPIVLWGSSYSGALVLRLAAREPAGVAAVLAFSPATGGAMADCRGEDVSERIGVPVLALRPAGEMERESAIRQFARFREQGHQTFVAEPGVHGSSMLVEGRVGASVEATWEVVMRFIARALE